MKTTLTILLMAIAINVTAQTWVEKPKTTYTEISVYVDTQNLLFGSKPTENKSALDVQVAASIKLESNVQLSLQLESFSKINYYNYMVQVGYVIGGDKIQFIPSVGAGQIIRKGDDNYYFGFFTYEANGEVKLNLYKNTGISIKGNLQRRPDVPEINYRFSGYGGVFYRF